MAVDIKGVPTLAVEKLNSPERATGGSHQMTASWSVPKDLTDDNNSRRATSVEIDWFLGIYGITDPTRAVVFTDPSTSTHTVDLSYFTVGSKTYTRSSFYPLSDTILSYTTVRVIPKNSKGKGKYAEATRHFYKPRKPSISMPEFDSEHGRISATITSNAGEDAYERYDTRYKITVINPFLNNGKPTDVVNGSTTNTSYSIGYDSGAYQNLTYAQYIKVTFKAWTRGYAGDSEVTTRTAYISYPARTTIKSVSVSSKGLTGQCRVAIDTNASTTHPVDKVVLQYAADVDYAKASDIPVSESVWTTSEIMDNGNCFGLTIPVADIMPSRGKYTWLRVASYHMNEAVLLRYSTPVRVKALETPAATATNERVKILSAEEGDDGRSAIVQLGWNADGQDDATGTEISWSESRDTWKSTEEPKKYQFTWSDGQVTSGGVTYQDSATITIKGLTEGQKYYIRARRYLEGDTTTYSPYSNTSTVLTSEEPETIVASADRYVPSGRPLTVTWSFAGNKRQKEWQILKVNTYYNAVSNPTGNPNSKGYYEKNGDVYTRTTDTTVVSGKTYYERKKSYTVIRSGKSTVTSTQISAKRLSDNATDGTFNYVVEASSGSGFVTSEEHTVVIVEKPTLSMTVPTTMTSQYSFNIGATTNTLCDIALVVTSNGITGQFPQGILTQAEGDVIYSRVFKPDWTESNGVYTATLNLAKGLDFWDGGYYMVSAVATDRESGLQTDEKQFVFNVDWQYKALKPVVTLTPIHTVDDEGNHTRAVQIDLLPPTGATSTSVYDIYRMDVDKPSLIGESFPLECTTTDEYAPFGSDLELKYRVAHRTINGDVAFTDVSYEAPCDNMRFDWQGGSLELPYGLTIGDSYKKSTEIRHHMDGGVDAYWNQNIERASSLGSSIIKISQPNDVEKARKLARYAGAVFVRLPNGSAFEADVQVTDLSVKNEAVTTIELSATEIDLTEEFSLPIPDELQED